MTTTNIQTLENNIAATLDEIKNYRNETKETLNKVVAEWTDGIWKVTNINKQSLTIGFVVGQWNDSYRTLDIYHGYDETVDWEKWNANPSNYKPSKKFMLQTNVSACGTFDLMEPNEILTYYQGVSLIVTNTEFQALLRGYLQSFDDRMEILQETIQGFEKEIETLRNEIRAKEEAKELEEKTKEVKKIISKNKVDGLYILMTPNENGEFKYRGKNYIPYDIRTYAILTVAREVAKNKNVKVLPVDKIKY